MGDSPLSDATITYLAAAAPSEKLGKASVTT
jgi:hypothetical protein